MKLFLAISLLIVIAAAIVPAQLKRMKAKKRLGVYRRRKLMTDNESEFFGRLVLALPDHDVFPQVAMSALIEAASRNRQQAYGDYLRIAQQRVDYVVCSRAGEVVAVVELDDQTHVQAKDRQRDARLEQAGIRTVRFQSRRKPGPAEIAVLVLGTAPVAAPAPGPAEPMEGAPAQ